jgi:uncharacterized protein
MKTKISLGRFKKLYDTFDKGHDQKHMQEVCSFSLKLAKKYCPSKLEIVYVAATLHDIGLSINRNTHEIEGYKLIKNDQLIKNAYKPQDFKDILEAVRQHRASTGKPSSTIAKIVSDADKVSAGTSRVFQRAYFWGEKNLPQLNHSDQVIRAAQHLHKKFGPQGTGTRLYFKESQERQDRTYGPIFAALKNNDITKLESILKINHTHPPNRTTA